MTTANLAIAELAESQSGKATTVNEALHVLDALVQCAIIDRDLTAPPGSPVDGDVYIPAATATGAWAGKENQLAHWDVNSWKFYPPEEGWLCYVRDENALLNYTGSAWAVLAGSGAPAGTVTSVALTVPAELSVSGSPITSSGTLAVTKANQSANQVFAGPTSGGAAAPAFRALVAADMVYRNLVLEQIVFGFTTDVTTGDGAGYMVVPSPMNGLNLVRVHARVITAGTTGTTDIQVHNVTLAADMLSTKITIDSGETGSDTAATPPVIDTGNNDVATNDLLRIDVDAVSTTKPKGLLVTLEFA